MSNRVEGERVFCYQCENEWDRAHGGLQCPRCESEFVEIVCTEAYMSCTADETQLSPGSRPDVEDPPEIAPDSPMDIDDDRPLRSLQEHNPWGPPASDPDEADIRTIHFGTGGGGHGTFQFSTTHTTSFGGPRQQSWNSGVDNGPAADEVMRSFQDMVNNILGGGARVGGSTFGGTINVNGRTTHFGSGTRDAGFAGAPAPPEYVPDDNESDLDTDHIASLFSMLFPGNLPRGGGPRQPGGPLDMLSMLLDPRNARSGDAVFSQEAYDRVMSQLMDQTQQNGAPPAPQELINQLPKRKLEKAMAGDDGHAECSICMDRVELGTEVTVLPCNHWFHFECIESWLKEHDTCPHCRNPITPPDQRNQPQSPPQGGRGSSRRASSVATPFTQMPQDGSRQNPHAIPDSPSDIRAARDQYYGRQRTEQERERPSSERRPSRRDTGSRDDGGDGGGGGGAGVSGWIRSHMPFS